MTVQERVQKRRIGIIGLARSGMAAARLIVRLGGIPLASDIRPATDLVPELEELQALGVTFETGGHTERLLEADYLILSPGVPRSIEIVRKAYDIGLPIFSEIELASWFCRGRIIAITGSNGKTTTTTLTGEILARAGIPHRVCGNIGTPFADAVTDIPEDGFAVLEVSSFQLELIEEFAPHVAMVLNLTPDHLDRYDDFNEYRQTKYNITLNQTENDYLILNADDTVIDRNNIETRAQKLFFSIRRALTAGVAQRGETLVGSVHGKEYNLVDVGRVRMPGPHNLQNAAAAALAGLLVGATSETITATLEAFPGVEHRLEDVTTVAGIRFVNDSKATNVDSVKFALLSIDTPIYLIAGGRDKAGDYEPLVEYGRNRVKGVILIGEAREKMFDALARAFPLQFAGSMDEAVEKAFAAASPGDTVLLSPACASFDMFKNFEERGRVFKNAVKALRAGQDRPQTEPPE